MWVVPADTYSCVSVFFLYLCCLNWLCTSLSMHVLWTEYLEWRTNTKNNVFFLFTALSLKRNRKWRYCSAHAQLRGEKNDTSSSPKLHLPFFFSLYFLSHWIGRQMLCDQPWHVIILFLVCLMSHYPDAPSQSRWYCL